MAFEIVLLALAFEAGEGVLTLPDGRQGLHLVLVRRRGEVDALVEDRNDRDHLRVDLDELVGLPLDASELAAQLRDRNLGTIDVVERGLDDALDPLDVLGTGDVQHLANLIFFSLELALLGIVLRLLCDDRGRLVAAGLQAIDPLRDQEFLAGDLGLGGLLDTAEKTGLIPQLSDVALERFLVGDDLARFRFDLCGTTVPVGLALAILLDLGEGIQHDIVAGGPQRVERIQVVDQRMDHLAKIKHALVHIRERLLHLGEDGRRR